MRYSSAHYDLSERHPLIIGRIIKKSLAHSQNEFDSQCLLEDGYVHFGRNWGLFIAIIKVINFSSRFPVLIGKMLDGTSRRDFDLGEFISMWT